MQNWRDVFVCEFACTDCYLAVSGIEPFSRTLAFDCFWLFVRCLFWRYGAGWFLPHNTCLLRVNAPYLLQHVAVYIFWPQWSQIFLSVKVWSISPPCKVELFITREWGCSDGQEYAIGDVTRWKKIQYPFEYIWGPRISII